MAVVTAKSLREDRAKLVVDARVLLDAADATPESLARATAMLDESDAIMTRVTAMERAERVENELGLARAVMTAATGVSADEQEDKLASEKRVILALLRNNARGLSDAEKQEYINRKEGFIDPSNAASTTSSPGGGYSIAPLFQRDLLVRMLAYGNVRALARRIETDTGANLPWPTMDDTSNVATIVAENTQLTMDTDLVFGSTSIQAWTYKAGPLVASLQILQDSAFDFDSLIRDAMANRLARGQNRNFTNGTGTGQPQGVVTGATQGVVAATGGATSVNFDNMIDLIHSLDPAYRPGSRFMCHDTTLQALRKVKDSNGRYLWQPYDTGTAGAPPGDTIWGYPLTINQDMPVLGANAKSIIFGNFDNYIVRDVLGMQMLRLTERYADFLQVGYIAFMRSDARFITALNAAPVKYFQNSAT